MEIDRNGFLIPPYPWTNFDIRKYYENEPRFNGAYSRNNLTKTIKDGGYAINLEEYADVIVSFDSFTVGLILRKCFLHMTLKRMAI